MIRGHKADKPESYASIERAARAARTALAPEVGPTGRLPGVALFERLGQFRVDCGMSMLPMKYDVRDIACEGETRFDPEAQAFLLSLSEGTYARLEEDEERARFTLPHEIGHLCLHSNLVYRLLTMPASSMKQGSHPSYFDTEWQADAFAGAMLMPAQSLRSLIDKPDGDARRIIKRTFGVSGSAAEVRLRVVREYPELMEVR